MGKRVWPPRICLHRPSGREYIRVDRKIIYLGKVGTPEVQKNYAELIVKLAEQQPVEQPARSRRDGLTVAELVEKWDAHASDRYSNEGREAAQYRYALDPLLHVHGKTAVRRFGAVQLEEVRDEMLKRGWNRKVVNRRVIRLRTVWRWAERKGHAPAGSWAALRVLEPIQKGDRRAPEPVSRKPCEWKELARVCRHCAKVPRDMLLICWYTGARPGEVRRMRVREIEQSAAGWVFRPEQHKGTWRGQDRLVAIGPRAQKVLTRHLAGKKPGAYVFASGPAGKPYRDDSFARAVARACERAGMGGICPYVGRHSAKQRITRALGIDAARAALGQASLTTTDLYAAGQDEKLAREAARKMG